MRRKFSCKSKNSINNTNSNIEDTNILPKMQKNLKNTLPNSAIITLTNSADPIFKYKCKRCEHKYKHYASLYKHIKSKHPKYDEEINELQTQKEEMKQLKAEIEELKKLIINKPIINNTNNTTNNNNNDNSINNSTINNTINIIKFGSETVDDLNKEEIKKILFGRNVDPIMAIIESTHFNDRLPQQHNIKYTNINSKYADIHNGNKWEKENVNNVVDNLLENHTNNLNILSNQLNNSKKINRSVKNIIDEHITNAHLDSEERKVKSNKKIVKNINEKKEEIKLFIHNKSV